MTQKRFSRDTRDIFAAVRDFVVGKGLPEPRLTMGGKHAAAVLQIGDHTRKVTIPVSPKGQHHERSTIGHVRRLLRQEGIQE